MEDVFGGMFDGGWWTIIVALFVSPGLVALTGIIQDWIAKRVAASRLRRDPLYDAGSVLLYVRDGGRELIGRCRVHSITTGRIEVRGIDEDGNPDGKAKSWTVRDFIKLDSTADVR